MCCDAEGMQVDTVDRGGGHIEDHMACILVDCGKASQVQAFGAER